MTSLVISAASIVSILSAVGCGRQASQSETAGMRDNLESSRALTLSCRGSTTPVKQLALELAKQCRAQNAELKAAGLPACQQDQCSDLVTLESASKNAPGASYIYDSQGHTVGIKLVLSTDIRLSTQEKLGLICYAPELKADELLGSMATRCK